MKLYICWVLIERLIVPYFSEPGNHHSHYSLSTLYFLKGRGGEDDDRYAGKAPLAVGIQIVTIWRSEGLCSPNPNDP